MKGIIAYTGIIGGKIQYNIYHYYAFIKTVQLYTSWNATIHYINNNLPEGDSAFS